MFRPTHITLAALIAAATVTGPLWTRPAEPTPDPLPAVYRLTHDGLTVHGTAFHIGGGLVLTAEHVTLGRPDATLTTKSGDVTHATVLWADAAADVALLKLDADAPPAPWLEVRCTPSPVGEPIRSIGHPTSRKWVTSAGTVASEVEEGIQTMDITMAEGMSGGPVLDTTGRVVGLNHALLTRPGPLPVVSPTGVSFMVPSEVICKLIEERR